MKKDVKVTVRFEPEIHGAMELVLEDYRMTTPRRYVRPSMNWLINEAVRQYVNRRLPAKERV